MWGGTTLTFEGLGDSQSVDFFYPGITFTNAVAEIAGFSLNEAEFPPASGVTVAVAGDGQISFDLNVPVPNFSAFFTHSASLTIEFFLAGNPVGAATSAFTNNLAISGDPGTAPNEAIVFHSDQGFDSAVFSGGGAFAVDDITFDAGQAAPEPSAAVLTLAGAVFAMCGRYRRVRAQKNRG
jgi:hypothetical protein